MLTWVPLLAGRLNSATDGGITLIEHATVDPLKKQIKAHFRDPIPGKQSWLSFQIISYAFAAVNDSAVSRIYKVTDNLYIIEVLIKNRHKISNFDPFVDDWKSNRQKNKEKFMKYIRDKAKELEEELSNESSTTSTLPSDPNMWNR